MVTLKDNSIQIKLGEVDPSQTALYAPRIHYPKDSTQLIQEGLIIIDCDEVPASPGTWPSFWLFGQSGSWPCSGEIDVIEGVTTSTGSTVNYSTFHTMPGCTQTITSQPDCNSSGGETVSNCGCNDQTLCPYQGCGVSYSDNSFGISFNKNVGGTYAVLLMKETNQVTVWFWPRGDTMKPDFSGLVSPEYWATSDTGNTKKFTACPGFFKDMCLIIDTTVCGYWAGNSFDSTSNSLLNCTDYALSNNMNTSFWNINFIKLYSLFSAEQYTITPRIGTLTASTKNILFLQRSNYSDSYEFLQYLQSTNDYTLYVIHILNTDEMKDILCQHILLESSSVFDNNTSVVFKACAEYFNLNYNDTYTIDSEDLVARNDVTLWGSKEKYFENSLILQTNLVRQNIRYSSKIEDTLHVIVVTSNYNHYKSRDRLIIEFIQRMESENNVALYVVELSYDGDFRITDSNNKNHLQLNTTPSNIWWHKENLMNIGVQKLLPPDWKAFAWIDSDIEFENEHWVTDTLRLLTKYDVVQLYSHALDMYEDMKFYTKESSVAYHWERRRYIDCAHEYDWSHPGYAFAMTRITYEKIGGFIDITLGCQDILLIHGITKNFKTFYCYLESYTFTENYNRYLEEKFMRIADANLCMGYVPGVVRHHFHGNKRNRQYLERVILLVKHAFDPFQHMSYDENGLLLLRQDLTGLQNDLRMFMTNRKED